VAPAAAAASIARPISFCGMDAAPADVAPTLHSNVQ
jgi:hypothetical protein